MNWSKIQYTELATDAYWLMGENHCSGCHYHNNSHIREMYDYLEETQEPYDEALDWAIMFHDVVYDDKPEKEERSADLFVRMAAKSRGCSLSDVHLDRVYRLILNTRDHIVDTELKGSSAIIRADLHALADKVSTVNNYAKIMNESLELYNCSVEEFAKANIDFMEGLLNRVARNQMIDPDYSDFYKDIQQGIILTQDLSKAIL